MDDNLLAAVASASAFWFFVATLGFANLTVRHYRFNNFSVRDKLDLLLNFCMCFIWAQGSFQRGVAAWSLHTHDFRLVNSIASSLFYLPFSSFAIVGVLVWLAHEIFGKRWFCAWAGGVISLGLLLGFTVWRF